MMILLMQSTILRLLAAAGTPMILIDSVAPIAASPQDFVNEFTKVGLGLGIAVAIVLVALGGYTMLTSGGDATKIKNAQEQIQNAIMGFLLILAAVAVVRIILNALGIANLVG